MHQVIKLNFIFLLCFLISSDVFGQTESSSILYNWFDSITPSSNKTISNGYEYVDKYRVINDKHPYFKSPDFKLSTLTYKDQPYFSVNLKFNLYSNQLILYSKQKENGKVLILENTWVSNFKIENHYFEKISSIAIPQKNDSFFCEVIVNKKDIKLYKKHSKKMKKKKNENTIYYEFFNNNTYYFYKNNTLTKIESLRTFKNLYPKKIEIINLYISKTSKNTSTEIQYKNLLLELI